MSTLFPYTTLFRSSELRRAGAFTSNERGPRARLHITSSLDPLLSLPPLRAARGLHSTYSTIVFVDRKSTRLNSSHVRISYAVFCLKKKNNPHTQQTQPINNHRERQPPHSPNTSST